MISGIIFDLGNTLMYLNGDWQEIEARGVAEMSDFLVKQGLTLDQARFSEAFLAHRQKGFARASETRVEVLATDTLRATLSAFGYSNVDDVLIREALRHYFRLEEQSYVAFPDALDVLRQLDSMGYRLGMISNATDDPLIQRLVDRLGFRPWLKPALSSAGVGIRKPDPRIFQIVLDEWRLLPTQVVMVGDTPEADILGAQLAGLHSVLVNMHQSSPNTAALNIQADAQIDSLSLLPRVISALDLAVKSG
ncbi:MAG: HAD family hydrolase [Anaerolineae bacterium]|nr:HAD family hydrolase [Anaerolineae bacterium]MDH7473964.1 HAD family hydrolase [Anaerolineae bacterium]